jgi:hypothetical protein
MTRPTWMSEAVYRVLRTALQIFVGAAGAALIVVLTGYKQTHVFDISTLYFDGGVGGIILALTYVMNRKPTE